MATDHQRDSGPARPNAKLRKMMEQAELAKEREFYRYYQRPKADGGILSRQPSPIRSLAHALPAALPPSLGSPQPSEDKALTAFAQLGALRLNTRRCLISFFDRRNCYILAEATKTLSLHADQAEFKEDSLCWGATIFPKEQSICYYTVNLPVKFSGRPLDDFGDVPSLVVNDLSQDQRFKNYPFVIGPPYSRFYAGVPIRSPNGHSIGTYCVLDDKPRNGLSAFELDFLKDMAVTVMRHLEMNRATDDYRRGGIMVKSLGSFAEGKSGLEDWWMDPWDAEPPNSAGPTDTISLQRQRRSSVSFTTSPRISHEPVSVQRKDSIDSSIPSVKSPNATSPASGPSGSVSITPASEVMAEQRGPEVATKTASSTKDHDKDRIAPEITAAFSRAANMIVDATEAEGAVFFDAKISTFGGLVDDDFITEQPPEPDKPCTVLGYAHCKNPPYPSVPSNAEYSLSESVLRHLLRTYSHGQIFNFDDDIASPLVNSPSGGGELETSDGFPFTASRRSESTKSSDDENLLRSVFPKARSLVLYPLWDPHRDRWFASAIIWSSDPMRVFTSEQELSYLAAFSNSVMAEVARLDTKLADAAKADFISSISHELRSPLHGILGMTDLLKDTSIDVQQTNQVHTIETCGKTLLDTINHVLDFAKINNLTRGTSKRRKKRSQSAKHIISPAQGHTNDIMTLITDVDMAVLTEEALESVFAGYNFQKTAALTYDLSTKKDNAPPIAVIVDINKSDNYVFRTQPGAWRRVIMNLFGNALKYTPAGYIKVKLQVMPKIDITDDSCEFRITITDSGIGMSEDYVNNRLFHSFAQENPLSQGTGLGLSIVKQIVESLGGDIEVLSEKGRGTKFSVSCPLKESILSPTFYACGPEKEKERELLNVSKRTKGMVVRFVGFDEEEEYFVKSLKNKTATMLTLKALDNLCTDWFGLTRCYSSDTNKSPDLFLATESGARILRSEHSKHPDTASKAPVIVLCQGAESAQATTAQSATAITVPGQIFECIAQPIGPHKLAKALVSCLDRHANRLMAATSEVDIALPNVSQLSLKENTPPMTPKVNPDLSRPHITSAISAPEVRSVHNSPVKQTKSPVRSLNCLAVDDNPINLRLLRTFVEKLGHRHILATNGLEAFETYKKVTTPLSPSNGINLASLLQAGVDPTSRIDVILMDINMPEMDGLEATRQIRSHEIALGLSPVTIIALTGLASSEAQQEAHSSGVNLFLIKPVRLADLEVVLKGVVTGQESVSTDKAKDTEATPAPPGDITPRQNQIQATIPEIREATAGRDTIIEKVHEITPMSILQKDEIFVENLKEVAPKEVKRSQEREEGKGSGAMLVEQKSSLSSESLEASSQSKQEVPPAEAPQLLNHNENHIPVQQLQNVQEFRQ